MDSRGRRRLLAAAMALLLLLLLLLGGVAKFLLADGASDAPSPGAAGEGSSRGRDDHSKEEPSAPVAPPTAGGAIVDPAKKPEPPKAQESPESAPRAVEPATPAPPPDAKPGKYSGKVVDEATGRPVAGARVLLGITTADGSDRGWQGDRTGPDGSFQFDVLETFSRDAGRVIPESEIRDWKFDLRVMAAGYEKERIRAPEPEREVRLVRDRTPPIPGKVSGVVTKADGTAFHGRLKVESMESEWGWYACPYAWTDERGHYLLEGVPAGNWKMRVSAEGEFQTVVVPEGGEAYLTLKVHGSIDEGSDALPAECREVVVVGCPTVSHACLRAETRPGHFFRVNVNGDKTRFRALPLRKYRFVLERPGEEEIGFEVDVIAGAGPQSVIFDAK